MRSVRVNIFDSKLHASPEHRKLNQIMPAARRLYYACELTAEPKMLEPIYFAEITTPMEMLGNIYTLVGQRRGDVIEEN